MTNNDKPMTVTDAAHFLSVGTRRVREYIAGGLLKAYKLGNGNRKRSERRQWRIWRQDLIDFVNRKGG